MKRTFKGFTLVECLVAMAILAIAGTLMAEIYATVASRNNFNHFMNTSLANQMAYIEKYEDTDTVKITNVYTGTEITIDGRTGTEAPSGTNSSTNAYVQIQKLDKDGSVVSTDKYSFPVDIYVMYSRDTSNKGSNDEDYGSMASSFSMDGGSEKQGNLRYKYILGHTT